MKKEYNAPLIEYKAFSICEVLAVEEEEGPISFPYNDGGLGWT